MCARVASFCPAEISFPIVGTIYRVVKSLLVPNDRRIQIVACVVYVAMMFTLPCVVVLSLTGGDQRVYLLAHLIVAVRFSVRGASTIIRSFVKRCYPTDDVGDAEYAGLVVKVSCLNK